MKKLGDATKLQVAAYYNQYYVKQMQIGKNILLIVICESKGLDIGALDMMCADYKKNFIKIDTVIEEINK